MSLKFSLKLKEVPVDLDGASYFLRELTGANRAAFLERAATAQKKASSDSVDYKEASSLELYLVSLSLYDSAGALVPTDKLGTWPGSVIDSLSTAATELSALGTDKEDEEGNG